MISYQTKVWHVDNVVEEQKYYPQLDEASALLRAGEAIAFPTETVYGLGANALSSAAVKRIFEAKGRPSDNPLIVHIADQQAVHQLVRSIPEKAQRLMDAFWPGPLTLIFPKKEGIAAEVTAGLDSVGIRMPDHPLALALIRATGLPLAAPSANRSGRPSPTTAAHVEEDLQGKIAGIVDGGATGVGVESTVLDVTLDPPMILRPGGVTKEALERVVGKVAVDPAVTMQADEQPRAPGMKYQHYAPQAEMWTVDAPSVEAQTALIRERIGQARRSLGDESQEGSHRELKIGVLATTETQAEYAGIADYVAVCGSRHDLASVARGLYDALRSFDQQQVEFILAESFPTTGVGAAIMNRLNKAAGNQVIRA
ncbi:threonylcarbamoyl-AMP synthase [Ammoniphilus oxalaticus]|uniref:Threonylcarbamoyl-AMP synthase n=1 Tax=Ammoniphilus oxalaticus TaxID=66863 RepID=A0A419SGZ4_9BACL|nr:L-threonylcarbamoyladenylate synthase [Ammoniphilus oxalaticus]RKD23050.1 threonylcarbamoyl-AMP synthase [Ammoniphilus oxalaticus]